MPSPETDSTTPEPANTRTVHVISNKGKAASALVGLACLAFSAFLTEDKGPGSAAPFLIVGGLALLIALLGYIPRDIKVTSTGVTVDASVDRVEATRTVDRIASAAPPGLNGVESHSLQALNPMVLRDRVISERFEQHRAFNAAVLLTLQSAAARLGASIDTEATDGLGWRARLTRPPSGNRVSVVAVTMVLDAEAAKDVSLHFKTVPASDARLVVAGETYDAAETLLSANGTIIQFVLWNGDAGPLDVFLSNHLGDAPPAAPRWRQRVRDRFT